MCQLWKLLAGIKNRIFTIRLIQDGSCFMRSLAEKTNYMRVLKTKIQIWKRDDVLYLDIFDYSDISSKEFNT